MANLPHSGRHPAHWNRNPNVSQGTSKSVALAPSALQNSIDGYPLGQIKDQVCANHQFDEIDDEVDASWKLGRLPPRYLLKLAGILSPDFWLCDYVKTYVGCLDTTGEDPA